MKKEVNFGIGFIAGRPNVCKIINNYQEFLVQQLEELDYKVNITIFILYDLNYQYTTRTDFYGILPKTYKNIQIKYITPENIEESKKILRSRYDLTNEEVKLLIGNGYAKARNTILYYALRRKIDYLLFWDDDEYPIANVKKDKELIWIKQKNILQHIKNMEKTDVTFGYRCGLMSPIPYIQYTDEIKEEDYKNFIDGLENEVISWEKVSKGRDENSFMAYAEEDIATGKRKPEYIEGMGRTNFVLGSGICLNLRHLDKIPAFYNPPQARGEDTFFSCALNEKDSKVLKVPTYHFHDSFLKFTGLMKDKYPKRLLRISLDDNNIEQRFLKATIGWTKYKPLLYYIIDRENYKNIIEKTRENLEKSIPKMNTAFQTCDFTCLLNELDEYDKNVKKHYAEFEKATRLWDSIKYKIVEDSKK